MSKSDRDAALGLHPFFVVGRTPDSTPFSKGLFHKSLSFHEHISPMKKVQPLRCPSLSFLFSSSHLPEAPSSPPSNDPHRWDGQGNPHRPPLREGRLNRL